MQPLNHDMDDLMRKAAADYPVMPQGADWEKVAEQLHTSGSGATVEKREHGGLKKLLFLLPLLLAAFVCDRFFERKHGVLKKFESTAQTSGADKPTEPPTDETKTRTTNGAFVTNNDVYKKSGRKKTVSYTNPKSAFTSNKSSHNLTDITKESPNSIGFLRSSALEQKDQASVLFSVTTLQPTKQKLPAPLAVVEPLQRIKIIEKQTSKNNVKEQPHGGFKKFYISALAGPDWSRVKDQNWDETGYSVGLLVGYNFKKRWAVEGGVMWDKKAYGSRGDYFKTDKLYLPSHSKIMKVDGYCAMYEIPLNIRYNTVRKGNSLFFASAGVSSYLMQKEDYDYVYTRYNNYYSGNKVYKKASKDWFSVGNISVGYERRFMKGISVRLEPYVKIPLRGVGIGSLPLTSSGVLAGITYSIH